MGKLKGQNHLKHLKKKLLKILRIQYILKMLVNQDLVVIGKITLQDILTGMVIVLVLMVLDLENLGTGGI